MMRAAYNDGAEYMVRINDDSEFVTSDWVSKAVANLASYDPPNVGMVGPNCREGNTAIMTHDMVHRTHLDIFEHYYPDVFSAWWIDDWISKVYGPTKVNQDDGLDGQAPYAQAWNTLRGTTSRGAIFEGGVGERRRQD